MKLVYSTLIDLCLFVPSDLLLQLKRAYQFVNSDIESLWSKRLL